jgi:deoxyadenosine/deoxycytidine kinase
MLSVLKDDDESWDEFLERLARRERDVEAMAGFAGDVGIVNHMEAKNDELSESLDENKVGSDDLPRQ